VTAEPYLTARQVAERLAVQPGTVLDWFEAGDLPGFRLRGRKGAPLRFLWSEIEATMRTWRGPAGAPGREVSATRTGDARKGIFSFSSATAPPRAAPDEEEI
jgi:excisionase family DNA binding protein